MRLNYKPIPVKAPHAAADYRKNLRVSLAKAGIPFFLSEP